MNKLDDFEGKQEMLIPVLTVVPFTLQCSSSIVFCILETVLNRKSGHGHHMVICMGDSSTQRDKYTHSHITFR